VTPQEEIKWKREGLQEISSKLAIIANNRFNEKKDKYEWNLLLRFRAKLKQHIEKKYPY